MAYTIIQIIFQVISVVVLVDVLISYFMAPYHPFRKTLDAIVNPLLEPIRKIVPPVQSIDFSPVILLIAIQLVEFIVLKVI